jgi:hypothetical protein
MKVPESPRYRKFKERLLSRPGAKEAYEKGRQAAKAKIKGK